MTADRVLSRLQAWYVAQCDGNWEHEYGVRIETLDNPGWHVTIDLQETAADGQPFEPVKIERAENDWLRCRIEDDHSFHAYCGPQNLGDALDVFLGWAEPKQTTPAGHEIPIPEREDFDQMVKRVAPGPAGRKRPADTDEPHEQSE